MPLDRQGPVALTAAIGACENWGLGINIFVDMVKELKGRSSVLAIPVVSICMYIYIYMYTCIHIYIYIVKSILWLYKYYLAYNLL